MISKPKIDLTGKKFGRLTVLEFDSGLTEERKRLTGRAEIYWRVQCECGTVFSTRRQSLIQGGTKSCGCLHKGPVDDLTGQRFGRLIVLQYNAEVTDKHRRPGHNSVGSYYTCLCDCGTEKVILGRSLTCGKTTSCGCYRKEVQSKPRKKNETL